MKFSKRLKELRINKGFTQEDLAKKINISPSSISLYERGVREPNLNTLIQLAEILETSTDYLLGITDIKDSSVGDLQKLLKSIINKNR